MVDGSVVGVPRGRSTLRAPGRGSLVDPTCLVRAPPPPEFEIGLGVRAVRTPPA